MFSYPCLVLGNVILGLLRLRVQSCVELCDAFAMKLQISPALVLVSPVVVYYRVLVFDVFSIVVAQCCYISCREFTPYVLHVS